MSNLSIILSIISAAVQSELRQVSHNNAIPYFSGISTPQYGGEYGYLFTENHS
jgi:hypothetical protein